jgi:hypothetical protein
MVFVVNPPKIFAVKLTVTIPLLVGVMAYRKSLALIGVKVLQRLGAEKSLPCPQVVFITVEPIGNGFASACEQVLPPWE